MCLENVRSAHGFSLDLSHTPNRRTATHSDAFIAPGGEEPGR